MFHAFFIGHRYHLKIILRCLNVPYFVEFQKYSEIHSL